MRSRRDDLLPAGEATVEPWPPSHEVADHTAEVQVRLRAGSLADLLAEAGRALAGLQLRGLPLRAGGEWRPIEVTAPDRDRLLADWLNELIYLAESDRWVATEFDLATPGPGTLRGRARGVTLDRALGLVKAATMHGLRVDEIPGGLSAEVILDV
ncbi:MAG TPA: archease [Gemmatimonadales bacterium]|jgi:SHS2 domain-containing protein|nr:archease [Gemmatimonadales bacterium]